MYVLELIIANIYLKAVYIPGIYTQPTQFTQHYVLKMRKPRQGTKS